MALNINGTTGISGVDGSATAPALKGVDSNTGVSFGTDIVNVVTGGTTRATVDSSGNFGIGTTSPASFSAFARNLVVATSTNTGLSLSGNDSSSNYAGLHFCGGSTVRGFIEQQLGSTGQMIFNNVANGNMSFKTNNLERLRIQSDGTITFQNYGTLFGNTGLKLDNTTSGGPQLNISRESGGPFLLNRNGTDGQIMDLRKGWGAGGSIDVGVNSATYNTSSDYRLKENIVAISDGITRLKTLKPSRFNWIGDTDSTRDGFIAHEVTAVPEAITGTKDEVYTEDEPNINVKAGDPKYQGIDQSKLVPLLTAALQEAIAKIETLETEKAKMQTDLTALTARVTALEAA